MLVIGTPVDEHLNPSFTGIQRAIDSCIDHLRDGQILILRSTVFPGISEHIQRYLDGKGLDIRVAFCPERVAQGYAIEEFSALPADRQRVRRRDPRSRCKRAVRAVLLRVRRDDACRGRAVQADDQLVAVHPVRDGQPVLHDRERSTAWTSTASSTAAATSTRGWPACPAAASRPGRACSRTRCSSPRSATTTSCSATPRCSINEGLPSAHGRAGAAQAGRPRQAHVRHPRHGVQGGQRRPARVAELQAAQARSARGGRGALHRPVHRGTRGSFPLERGRSAEADMLFVGAAAPRRTGSSGSPPSKPVVDIWNSTGQGPCARREDPGHRLGRLHRRLLVEELLDARPRGRRPRQLLEVRPGRAELSTPSPLPLRRRATPRTSACSTELLADCDHFVAGAAIIGGIALFHEPPTTCSPRTSGSPPPPSTPRSRPTGAGRLQKITVHLVVDGLRERRRLPDARGRAARAARRRESRTASRSWPPSTSRRAPGSSTGCRTRSAGRSTASASARSGARCATGRPLAATSGWR